ncbi:hypothetical protein BX600DRAFT_470447 [Xylariales sp. PMI_506]|nr:hypothetical protein BX600DRAFT_470447 [Xylariales sp. PMI_506]
MRLRPTDELGRRLRNDVVEDRERLGGASWDIVYDVFKAWVLSQGIEDGPRIFRTVPGNVRYNSCIVVDEAALASIDGLPEQPPGTSEKLVETRGM